MLLGQASRPSHPHRLAKVMWHYAAAAFNRNTIYAVQMGSLPDIAAALQCYITNNTQVVGFKFRFQISVFSPGFWNGRVWQRHALMRGVMSFFQDTLQAMLLKWQHIASDSLASLLPLHTASL